jgi:hypothetical protein
MKKLIILLSFFLTGCGCLIGQVPPQTIVAGANCTATLPDYRPFFSIAAGCTGFNPLTQTPIPGTLVTTANSPLTVFVKVTSKTNGKFDQKTIIVSIADTVTPKLTPIGILAEVTQKQVNDLYNAGDKLLGFLDNNIMSQNWIDSVPGLRDKLGSDNFNNKMLITASYRKSDGSRGRITTFADSSTTINQFKK